jgi:hypothetical protein
MTRNTLDGFELFTAIGAHRDVFGSAEHQIDKAAQAIVFGQFKSVNLSVTSLGCLLAALGEHHFAVALDHFGAADLKKVLKKIDKYFVADASLSDVQLRDRIQQLAQRRVLPIEKKGPASKSTKKGAVSEPKRAAEWPTAMSPPTRKVS